MQHNHYKTAHTNTQGLVMPRLMSGCITPPFIFMVCESYLHVCVCFAVNATERGPEGPDLLTRHIFSARL